MKNNINYFVTTALVRVWDIFVSEHLILVVNMLMTEKTWASLTRVKSLRQENWVGVSPEKQDLWGCPGK